MVTSFCVPSLVMSRIGQLVLGTKKLNAKTVKNYTIAIFSVCFSIPYVIGSAIVCGFIL